ncbi:hypothetical protein HF086_006516 [Spodoptera exigua]|uniref:Peptidase S1 domain-containing protein n=1 Tax=Spodoptera exigua TaxID=7107 RepID=A0A922MK08_SPOEX|nr:hypothetical protein HF086_006516 [Spodoptera exigua]
MVQIIVVLSILSVLGKVCGLLVTNTLDLKYRNFRNHSRSVLRDKVRESGRRYYASFKDYPFVVLGFGQLQWRGRLFTAAALSKTWVITCAHCTERIRGPQIWYAGFDKPLNDNSPSVKVLDIFLHPNFYSYMELPDKWSMDNDISLLRTEPINEHVFGVLCSTDYTSLLGLAVTYVASGITANSEETVTRLLDVADAAIVNCHDTFRGFNRHLMCATPKCQERTIVADAGDSGSPLFFEGKIVGIFSYFFYNEFLVRNAYTPISPYLDWISHVIKNNTVPDKT